MKHFNVFFNRVSGFVCVLLLSLSFQSVLAQSKASVNKEVNEKVLAFEQEKYDFGVLKQKVPAQCTFTFTNQSAVPVTVTRVKTSCGCTLASQPKAAIMPGETSEISVSYDTNRLGNFSKSIFVYTDVAVQPQVLRITGKVE